MEGTEEFNPTDFLASFGVAATENPPAETDPENPPPETDPAATIPPATEGEEGVPGAAEGNETPPATEPPASNPMNAAFANMRVQNKTYKDTLDGVAKVLGIQDLSDPNTVLEQVNNLVITAQAKQQNVPPDLLLRMRNLEVQNEQYTQQQLQQQALLGFEKVKQTYELENQDLSDFADQLSKTGINPFAQEVDLITQYKVMNYDKLVQKAADKAVAEERARAEKAGSTGTTPPKGTGGNGPGSPEKIASVGDFTAWMKTLG